jgi:hypothetical protein
MWGMEERECRKEMENTSPFKLGWRINKGIEPSVGGASQTGRVSLKDGSFYSLFAGWQNGLCVCVCVCVREREREREKWQKQSSRVSSWDPGPSSELTFWPWVGAEAVHSWQWDRDKYRVEVQGAWRM